MDRSTSTMEDKVLVIDDDPELLAMTETWLREAGYQALTAKDGVEGLQRVYAHRPDLVLLDIQMPRMDGWDVCRRLREMCDIPIIIVSVNDKKADVLRGFALGVDDYVTKPFHFPELIVRVEALLRRYAFNKDRGSKKNFHNEDIDINWASHEVWVRDQKVRLSSTEFRLLACLVENRGWVLTHEQLLRKVWGPNYFGDKGYVKLYIRYLRKKIELDPNNPKWLLTERGVGYIFRA